MQVVPMFTEVIKIRDGRFCDLALHLNRMQATTNHFFGKQLPVDFQDNLIPEHLRKGIVKCRVVYSDAIHEIGFAPYTMRTINRIAIVANDYIDYAFKYLDRSCFDDLQRRDSEFDEILVIKSGLVTDTSYSNVVFEDEHGQFFTPTTTLLNGTKRRKLIKLGKIKEREISESDIRRYSKLYLINAMIDLEDNLFISTSNVIKPI